MTWKWWHGLLLVCHINQFHHNVQTEQWFQKDPAAQLGGARPCRRRFSEFTIHCARSVRQARFPMVPCLASGLWIFNQRQPASSISWPINGLQPACTMICMACSMDKFAIFKLLAIGVSHPFLRQGWWCTSQLRGRWTMPGLGQGGYAQMLAVFDQRILEPTLGFVQNGLTFTKLNFYLLKGARTTCLNL